ncbi:HNH endonuclease family protein [Streptomyces sp. NPDC003860]
MRLLRTALAGLLAVPSLLLTPAPATAVPGNTVTARLTELISALPIQDEGSRAGYSREAFRHWVDADRDGCNTRAEVLLAEATTAPEVTGRCTITAQTGTWWSWYDETVQSDKFDVDIDHMVALGEAWDSGAADWSPAERQAYANDLDDERSLTAVHDSANQSKADRDPAEWMPPAASATCRYLTDWAVVKTRWQLHADPAEHTALHEIAADCPNPSVTLTLAR